MVPAAAALILAALVLVPSISSALTAAEVLVVVNERSSVSRRIADLYRHARGIPPEHVVEIATEPTEAIDRATFTRDVERPIGDYLESRRLVDQILVIVLTKDVPLKIRGTTGPNGTAASVDSELTLLYRTLVLGPLAPEGRVANPYFRPGRPGPFTRREFDTYLVTRLDGYTWDDVRGLIARGLAPARRGTVVLEPKRRGIADVLRLASGTALGNAWLREAQERLKARGVDVLVRESGRSAVGPDAVIGYAGWGSNDSSNKARAPGLPWVPGAVASWFVSSSARTFRRPPPGWTVGSGNDPRTFHAGSPQSLIGDLIAEGATGAAGSVYEPYLNGAARPDIFLPAYIDGYTLAESFSMALPDLSWQAVVGGDALAATFGPRALRPAPARGMSMFLRRRVAVLENVVRQWPDVADARRALALAYADKAREEVRDGELDQALVSTKQALAISPTTPAALCALGAVLDSRGERARAAGVFRFVLRIDADSECRDEAERWLRRHRERN